MQVLRIVPGGRRRAPIVALSIWLSLSIGLISIATDSPASASPPPTQVPATSTVQLSRLAANPGNLVTVTTSGVRPSTKFGIVNNTKRAGCDGCDVASSITRELAVGRSSSTGELSVAFLVPLDWRGGYRVDLIKVKGGARAAEPAWLSVKVAAGRPLMTISTDDGRRGDKVTLTLTGLRKHTRYAALSATWRDPGNDIQATNSNPTVLASGVSSRTGKLKLTFRIPLTWRLAYHLIYVDKVAGSVPVANARTWLNVARSDKAIA